HPNPAAGGAAMTSNRAWAAAVATIAMIGARSCWANCEDYREIIHAIGQRGNVNDYARNVVVKGDMAYLSTSSVIGKAGLYAVDIHDPTRPVTLSEWTGGWEHSVGQLDLQGDDLYVASWVGSSPYIYVFDVHDPRRIVLAHSLRLAASPYVYGMAVRGSRVYVANNRSLEILSTDPTTDRLTQIDCGESVGEIRIVGGIAFVGHRLGGVRMYDPSDPDSPRFLGSPAWRGRHLSVSGNLLLALRGRTLTLVDVSTPSAPRVTGTYRLDVPGECVTGAGPGVALVGLPIQIEAIDISDPA